MSKKTPVVLSLDWDYVTSDCSGVPHGHCGFCKKADRRRGLEAERRHKIGWEPYLKVLKNITIDRDCPIYVAECHASIISLLKTMSKPVVYDFDHHHDKYDFSQQLHCGNWIHHLNKKHGVVYVGPGAMIPKLDAVFLCKSSPWTPKSMDREFFRFVNYLEGKSKTTPIFIGHRKNRLEKDYDSVIGRDLEMHVR